jgi:hypothetical protein
VSDLETYLDLIIGDRDGYLHLAHGHDPFWNAKGKYDHREFRGQAFHIPEQRGRIAIEVKRWLDKGDDVYVCPYLHFTDKRRQGNALPPMMLHVDLDGEPADQVLYDTLNPLVVSSGRNRHLYVPLSRPVDLGTWRRLQKALVKRLGGDAKVAENDLLRLPGTFNFKPATPGGPPGVEFTGEPSPVVILNGPTA